MRWTERGGDQRQRGEKMKITQPAKEIEVCDRCRSDGYLQQCIVCGKMYCLTCKALIMGCWVEPNVGKCCQDREDVLEIVARFSEQITPIIRARSEALKALNANATPT